MLVLGIFEELFVASEDAYFVHAEAVIQPWTWKKWHPVAGAAAEDDRRVA